MAQQANVHFQNFDTEVESIRDFLSRIEAYFKANSIEDAKKAYTCLSLLGPKSYKVIRNAALPEDVNTLPYEEVKELMTKYFEEESNPVYERYKFSQMVQAPTEPIENFILRLQIQGGKCALGGFLFEALRDRLITGLNNRNLNERLLQEKNLDFGRAQHIALSFETANRETVDIENTGNELPSLQNEVDKLHYREGAEGNTHQEPGTSMMEGVPSFEEQPSTSHHDSRVADSEPIPPTGSAENQVLCSICYKQISPNPEREIGVLMNCRHAFCLECIKKWRKRKKLMHRITYKCPECRVHSPFYIPTERLVGEESKQELVRSFREKMSRIPCRWYRTGRGICLYGVRCVYKHSTPQAVGKVQRFLRFF